MELLVAVLTGWIALQTGLSTAEPPQIELVTPNTMSERAFGPGIAASPLLRALYSQPANTVYLRKNWDASNLRDQSELLHELVHHFQNIHKLHMAAAPSAKSSLTICRSNGCARREWRTRMNFSRSTPSLS